MSRQISAEQIAKLQRHWKENGPIKEQLRAVVDPFCEMFREEATERWGSMSPEHKERLLEVTANAYEMPYGEVAMLPAALFGDITKDTAEPTRGLVVPTSPEEKMAMIERYYEWFDATMSNYQLWVRPNDDMLLRMIDTFAGHEYPEQKWRMAAGAVQRTLTEELYFFMETNGINRYQNAAPSYGRMGAYVKWNHAPYETYALSFSRRYPPENEVMGIRDYIALPIGEYGKEGAAKLARVTILLNDHMKWSHAAKEYLGNYRTDTPGVDGLLMAHTARSRDRKDNGEREPAYHGFPHTVAEGVTTIAQTIAMLTSERIEPFETHDDFVRAVLDSDVIEQFTRLVNPGYIGPTTLGGVHLRRPVEMRSGKLALTYPTVEWLNDVRRVYMERQMAKWALYWDQGGEMPGMLGLPCPAAKPGGGISQIKEAFKIFYEKPGSELGGAT